MMDQTQSVVWMLCFHDDPMHTWTWYSYYVALRSGCLRARTLDAVLSRLTKALPW